MKHNNYILILGLFGLLISCSGEVNNFEEESSINSTINSHDLIISTDSLISQLAFMKTDSLDCSADVFWKIVSKGKAYIPKLIESLTDTTMTNIYHGCKTQKLNIGELSYFALEEIGDFPAFVVTQIQFDVISIQNGWSCWSFYDYLFNNKNKVEYQNKVKDFYGKSQFEFVKYQDSSITDCMRKHSITGRYEWKYFISNPSKKDSPYQVRLNSALENESIDNYYKDTYLQEKLISADDNKMLSITDSLFTSNKETELFYFIVFTKSMNGSDGFYSEALGLSAFEFITKKTEWFADYFNIAPKLTDKDMDNWAGYIYGEIQISREGQELKAINELETLTINNIKESRKEYRAVIEKLIEKIKKAHNKELRQ
jgi:hypothetical protein